MQNQNSVTQQIHTGSILVDRTVELKFIDAWMLTGKNPSLNVIAVLPVVDDITEGDGNGSFGEVVAQSYTEGHFLHSSRRSWRSRGASQTSGSSGSSGSYV